MVKEQEISYDQIEKVVYELEKLLTKFNIKINNGSYFEKVCLEISELFESFKTNTIKNPSLDHRDNFRRIFGSFSLMNKIVESQSHYSFPTIVPHLQLLNNTEFAPNTQSKVTDQGADKIIELYLAAACMQFTPSVILENAIHSDQGTNPDIICLYKNKSMAIACKTPHSFKFKTIFDGYLKALAQIQKASVDSGIAIINTKNILTEINNEVWPKKTP